MFSQKQIYEFNRNLNDLIEFAVWYHSALWWLLVLMAIVFSVSGIFVYQKTRTQPMYNLVVYPFALPLLIYLAIPFAFVFYIFFMLMNLGRVSAEDHLMNEIHGVNKNGIS